MTTKKERIKRLVKYLFWKILVFSVIIGATSYLINFPTFTNEMAMAQFENDNYSYAAWSAFVSAKNLFNSYYDLIICLFAGTVIYDIYEFIKINKGEN
jgi:uncharacterized membrane protein